MILQFKTIELIESEINNTEILTSIVSIFENGKYNLNKTYALIFEKNSNLANQHFIFPDEDFSIDLKDFSLRKIEFEHLDKKFAYFHNDLISQLDNSKNELERQSSLIADSLSECLFSCHAEMYLYFNYKVVFNREFNNKIYDENFKKEIFEKFNNVIGVILKDNYEIITNSYKNLSASEIQLIRQKYDDSLDYGKGFVDSIANFVILNEKALHISSEILKDRKYFYNFYIQRVFIKAFEVCERRIISYQNSTEYFGHEIVFSDERVEIKIFPTPFGFTQVDQISKLSKEGNLEKYLLNYLTKINLTKIDDEDIKNTLKTKWIFEKQDIINLFFVDRKYSLNKSHFGRQDRSYLFDSLMAKGQINLSISDYAKHCVQ